MNKGLRFRFAGAFLGVAVVVVALTAALTFFAVTNLFERYVQSTYALRHHRVVQAIEEAYAATGGDWEAVHYAVGYLGMMGGFDFVVRDTEGRAVFSSVAAGQGRRMRMGMGRTSGGRGPGAMMGGGMGRMMDELMSGGSPRPLSPDARTAEYPLRVDKRKVGSVAIAFPAAFGIVNALERGFRASLAWSALAAALLASLLGWAAGLLLSRRLVHPILRLRDATGAFARGDLAARVPVDSADEVGDLSESFNEMASRLQRLEGMRRKLTADIAHELRTPIAAAQNLVEAIRDGVLPGDDRNLGQLEGELARLGEIVADLRALSVAESGQLQLQTEPVDLREVVNEVSGRWAARFLEKGVELSTSLGEGAAVVTGDAEALERIFMNLVANAFKYTDRGGRVQLVVDTKTGDGQVEARVTDTGVGIDEAELPYVFERFYRGAKAKERGVEGTGVGLAIVRELVQAHRGGIRIESRAGEGTTVVVRLPSGIR